MFVENKDFDEKIGDIFFFNYKYVIRFHYHIEN